MPRAASYHRFVAEAEAFPFASPKAFELRGVLLERDHGHAPRGDTERLAEAFNNHVRPYMQGLSLELIAGLRNRAWFNANVESLDLASYLFLVKRQYLCRSGRVAELLGGEDLPELAARWRWLSLRLPQDLLVAATFADPARDIARDGGLLRGALREDDPTSDRVRLPLPYLRQLLVSGEVAETHVHLGGAFSFTALWALLARRLASSPPDARDLDVSGPPPFGDGHRFLSMLLVAFVARVTMASYLWHRERGATRTANFRSFVSDEVPGIFARALVGARATAARRLVGATFNALLHGPDGAREALPNPEIQHLYRALVGVAPKADAPIASPSHLAGRDPLSDWLRPAPRMALPETRFAVRMLRHLHDARVEAGRPDEALELAFWQYERVRCLAYRHVTQEPGTAGLDWFNRHYHRIFALRGPLDATFRALAVRHDAYELRLGAFEGRIAPRAQWYETRDEVRDLLRANHQTRDEDATRSASEPLADDGAGERDERQHLGDERSDGAAHARRVEAAPRCREVGLVLHFIKQRADAGTKCAHGDPANGTGVRYGLWFRQRYREVLALATALRFQPELLAVLRGVDTASSELAIPNFAVVPLIHMTRELSRDAAARLGRAHPEWEIEPFRVTVHAGEDYRRLVEGLRRIHELIQFRVVSQSDRVGHAIALGDDPRRWLQSARHVAQPREDRLDDLLWEFERYSEGDFPPSAGRLEYVRHQCVELARDVYGRDYDVDLLVSARRMRHDPKVVGPLLIRGASLGRHPSRPTRADDRLAKDSRARRLLHRYLTDDGVYSRGQVPIEVRMTDDEVTMLDVAQRFLRRLVGRMELTIESNPSSNLLIGDLLDLDEHPALRLSPVDPREADGGSVLLSVNVDDPLTFASSLADEYAYLYFALLRGGRSSLQAIEWLRRLRDNGFNSRFTLAASNVPAVIMEIFGRPRATRDPLPLGSALHGSGSGLFHR